MFNKIDYVIEKYYAEADGGLVNHKNPSELKRGEGTEADYYIFKIDICNSTILLHRRKPQTYLKVAHVFLSTIDYISREYGADTEQVEYEGDSVLAYFPNYHGMAMNVLKAAFFSRIAALKMKDLDSTFNELSFKTKIILHHSKLILGKIGPWGDFNLTAIGLPIHKVAHLEKNVPSGDGLATKEFAEKLSVNEKKHFLIPNYVEKKVEIQNAYPTLIPPNTLDGLHNYHNRLSATGLAIPPEIRNSKTQYKIEEELVNYKINWNRLNFFLQGKLKI